MHQANQEREHQKQTCYLNRAENSKYLNNTQSYVVYNKIASILNLHDDKKKAQKSSNKNPINASDASIESINKDIMILNGTNNKIPKKTRSSINHSNTEEVTAISGIGCFGGNDIEKKNTITKINKEPTNNNKTELVFNLIGNMTNNNKIKKSEILTKSRKKQQQQIQLQKSTSAPLKLNGDLINQNIDEMIKNARENNKLIEANNSINTSNFSKEKNKLAFSMEKNKSKKKIYSGIAPSNTNINTNNNGGYMDELHGLEGKKFFKSSCIHLESNENENEKINNYNNGKCRKNKNNNKNIINQEEERNSSFLTQILLNNNYYYYYLNNGDNKNNNSNVKQQKNTESLFVNVEQPNLSLYSDNAEFVKQESTTLSNKNKENEKYFAIKITKRKKKTSANLETATINNITTDSSTTTAMAHEQNENNTKNNNAIKNEIKKHLKHLKLDEFEIKEISDYCKLSNNEINNQNQKEKLNFAADGVSTINLKQETNLNNLVIIEKSLWNIKKNYDENDAEHVDSNSRCSSRSNSNSSSSVKSISNSSKISNNYTNPHLDDFGCCCLSCLNQINEKKEKKQHKNLNYCYNSTENKNNKKQEKPIQNEGKKLKLNDLYKFRFELSSSENLENTENNQKNLKLKESGIRNNKQQQKEEEKSNNNIIFENSVSRASSGISSTQKTLSTERDLINNNETEENIQKKYTQLQIDCFYEKQIENYNKNNEKKKLRFIINKRKKNNHSALELNEIKKINYENQYQDDEYFNDNIVIYKSAQELDFLKADNLIKQLENDPNYQKMLRFHLKSFKEKHHHHHRHHHQHNHATNDIKKEHEESVSPPQVHQQQLTSQQQQQQNQQQQLFHQSIHMPHTDNLADYLIIKKKRTNKFHELSNEKLTTPNIASPSQLSMISTNTVTSNNSINAANTAAAIVNSIEIISKITNKNEEIKNYFIENAKQAKINQQQNNVNGIGSTAKHLSNTEFLKVGGQRLVDSIDNYQIKKRRADTTEIKPQPMTSSLLATRKSSRSINDMEFIRKCVHETFEKADDSLFDNSNNLPELNKKRSGGNTANASSTKENLDYMDLVGIKRNVALLNNYLLKKFFHDSDANMMGLHGNRNESPTSKRINADFKSNNINNTNSISNRNISTSKSRILMSSMNSQEDQHQQHTTPLPSSKQRPPNFNELPHSAKQAPLTYSNNNINLKSASTTANKGSNISTDVACKLIKSLTANSELGSKQNCNSSKIVRPDAKLLNRLNSSTNVMYVNFLSNLTNKINESLSNNVDSSNNQPEISNQKSATSINHSNSRDDEDHRVEVENNDEITISKLLVSSKSNLNEDKRQQISVATKFINRNSQLKLNKLKNYVTTSTAAVAAETSSSSNLNKINSHYQKQQQQQHNHQHIHHNHHNNFNNHYQNNINNKQLIQDNVNKEDKYEMDLLEQLNKSTGMYTYQASSTSQLSENFNLNNRQSYEFQYKIVESLYEKLKGNDHNNNSIFESNSHFKQIEFMQKQLQVSKLKKEILSQIQKNENRRNLSPIQTPNLNLNYSSNNNNCKHNVDVYKIYERSRSMNNLKSNNNNINES